MTAHPSLDVARASRRGRRGSAAIAAGLAVLALITCAGAAHRTSMSTAEATAVAADLRAMYERIQGSLGQRSAALLVAHVAKEEPVRECMKSSGFAYTLAPFADPFAGTKRLLLPTEVSAVVDPGAEEALQLAPASVEEPAAPEPHRDAAYARMSPAKQRLYDDTVLMCEPPVEGQVTEFAPTVSGDLDAEFLAMLRRVGEHPDVVERMEFYGACMRRSGYDVHTVGELYAAVTAKFRDDEGTPLRPESSLMPIAKKYQQDAMRADAACRTPAWTGAMALAQAELADFVDDHAAELAALDAEWAAVDAKAAEAKKKLSA